MSDRTTRRERDFPPYGPPDPADGALPAALAHARAHRESRRRAAADDDTPTADDVTGVLRVGRWLWRRKAAGVFMAAAFGAGRFAQLQYVPVAAGVAPAPALSGALLDSIRALRGTDSQLKATDGVFWRMADTSRADRAQLRRKIEDRSADLGRGICALATPAQRALSRLPCTSLLNGGDWPIAPAEAFP